MNITNIFKSEQEAILNCQTKKYVLYANNIRGQKVQKLMTHQLTKQEQQIALLGSKRCLRNIQAGDIATNLLNKEAVMLFGKTKAGKTTAAHLFSRLPLIATKIEGDLAFTSNLSNPSTVGIIGKPGSSETEIPNIFLCQIRKDKAITKIRVIDQPGYGDSNGFYKIYSNGYFHYRTFSKNQRLKFILVVNKNDLQGIAENLKSTIFNFTSAFNNYNILQPQILNATSLLITKVDHYSKIQDILEMLYSRAQISTNMTEGQIKIYTNFLLHMIDQNKVFMFKKPMEPNQILQGNNIFDKIYSKTTFWERGQVGDTIDMSVINFSVSGQIIGKITNKSGNVLFKPHFEYFITHNQKRILDLLANHTGSLLKTIKSLIKDSTSESISCTFITNNMIALSKYQEYDEKYEKQRQKIRCQIFQGKNLPVISESKEYFIKKFQVLDVVVAEIQQVQKITQINDRSVASIDKIRDHLLKVLQALSCICLQKPEHTSIFYKFAYVIMRLIEQARIFSLILFTDAVSKDKIQSLLANVASKADFIRPLHDNLVSSIVLLKVVDLKKQFLKKHHLSITPTIDVINFFEKIKDQDVQLKTISSNFMLRFYRNTIKNDTNRGRNLDFALKLLKKRDEFYKMNQTTKKDDNISFQTMLLSDALGQIFAKLKQYNISRLFYQSTLKVKYIFDVFQMQISEVSTKQYCTSKLRQIYKQYGLMATYYQRTDVAAKCFDQMYSLSQNMSESRQASSLRVICSHQDKITKMQIHYQ